MDKKMKEYPNLEGLARGTMSGHVYEWPQLKMEAINILSYIKELEEGIESLFLLIDNAEPGAWANGNVIWGSDEGTVLASRMIDELRNKLIEKEKDE